MEKAKKSTGVLPDKTVTIDGETHEILRVESFESKGTRSIKSLIAEAVKKTFGKKPRG